MSSYHNNKTKKGEVAGFSMIEMIIAFAILATSFIGLSSSFPIALSVNKSSENGTIATYLVQEKIEEIESLSYDFIATGTIESLHKLSATTTDYLYQFERETVVSNVDGNLAATSTDSGLKKISTSVYYPDPVTRSTKLINITILSTKR